MLMYYFYLKMDCWVKIKFVHTENGAARYGRDLANRMQWKRVKAPHLSIWSQGQLSSLRILFSLLQNNIELHVNQNDGHKRDIMITGCETASHHFTSSSPNKAQILKPLFAFLFTTGDKACILLVTHRL